MKGRVAARFYVDTVAKTVGRILSQIKLLASRTSRQILSRGKSGNGSVVTSVKRLCVHFVVAAKLSKYFALANCFRNIRMHARVIIACLTSEAGMQLNWFS